MLDVRCVHGPVLPLDVADPEDPELSEAGERMCGGNGAEGRDKKWEDDKMIYCSKKYSSRQHWN